jgi:plastocyanin
MRARHLAAAAATILVAILVAAPAESQAPTLASIQAADNVFTTDDGGPPNVTIAAGGHVNFAYFMGNSRHNVVFTGALPTVCGSSGGPPATASALPGAPTPAGWDGGCDFNTPGTYPFVCGLHSSMTGSVTVVAGTGTPPPPPPPVSAAPVAAAASGLKVAVAQRGLSVRGTVRVARTGSRLLARAFARRGAVYGGRSRLPVEVGRQLRTHVSATTVTFATALGATARRALRRNGRLAISLRLTVTPAEGKSYTATRAVVLRPR